ncbi:tripartite tricarboxylate transporter TctB family protein [Limnochorda pilosa]|uniref:DUF1468 domain-containing protein n=1 Tax=Limnochorda pilosa TaxID=1555112 RepID=A0A0K2SLQ0_LIMPI|nr:tripartite tricarboxylate transporter TctB family protein [Limnochorda pilosa]BAS28030.1 hypothetical protein LIP_2189 [Limnochorda pilosa]
MGSTTPARRQIAWGEAIVPALTLVLAAIYWIDVHDISRPELNLLLPRPVLLAIAILSLILLGQVVVGRLQGKAGEPIRRTLWRLAFVVLAAGYLRLFGWIGFLPASILFIAATLLYLGVRNAWSILLVSVLGGGAIYAVFAYALSVRF